MIAFAVSFLTFRASPVQRVHRWLSPPPPPPKKLVMPDIYRNEPEHPGFFDWETTSSFNPVRIPNAKDKSVQELCASFPEDLLTEIQPVLKTGHGVLDSRVRPQLRSVSHCLSNLLIFSDTNEHVGGHDMIDVLADIPKDLSNHAHYLEAWRNGSLSDGTASRRAGWKADKFKFIPAATSAWRLRPGRKWYVFYEADTYVVWDNVFRLLENFDPNLPYYFGSPSPGRDKTWFANGGPGYILSREAMHRLTKDDFDQKTGKYLGENLLRRYWRTLVDDCCGDSVLGWALWGQSVSLSGLWPMFNPHAPHLVPFSDKYWCQPMVTMHKPLEEDLNNLWRWQWENRMREVSQRISSLIDLAAKRLTMSQQRPLIYRDLAMSYLNMSEQAPREDWDNRGWDNFDPPVPSEFYNHDPHASFDACGEACKAHDGCYQWSYHLRQCKFARSFRLGNAQEPGLGKAREKSHPDERESDWNPEDLRWMAGWDTEKIAKWMSERPCEKVKWPRPSTKRIF